MKIGDSLFGLKISSAGLSVQRKKMNLIAENIANASTTKTDEGTPYQRKFVVMKAEENPFVQNLNNAGATLKMAATNQNHISNSSGNNFGNNEILGQSAGISSEELKDKSAGETVYMPEHPDADKDGFVKMPNVNIITEMVDMIAATRSYEANLTALNSAKQMAKDSLEI